MELIGERSSGRFSTVLATLAATTTAGEAVALVDLGDGLDPRIAAAAGVDLERLLWVRPPHLKKALVSAEMLLAGGFPLVIIDLGNPPVPGGRGVEAAWLRLARAAQSHDAVLLVSSPYRASGTAATGVVKAMRGRPRWSSKGSGTPSAPGSLVPAHLGKAPRPPGYMQRDPSSHDSRSCNLRRGGACPRPSAGTETGRFNRFQQGPTETGRVRGEAQLPTASSCPA